MRAKKGVRARHEPQPCKLLLHMQQKFVPATLAGGGELDLGEIEIIVRPSE
jgi:hypothetical protein